MIRGVAARRVSPQATAMETIALVTDHDTVSIDIKGRCLCLEISEEEMMQKREEFSPLEQGPTIYLKRYVHRVTSSFKPK